MKYITVGILAHVDAGKTTLSEALLYDSGRIRKRGSVDSGDTVMDFDEIEKRRGITIYSSEAYIEKGSCGITIVDTPGHSDFSAEAERTVSVMDAAILIISGTEGVQSHTRTIFEILKRNHVRTLIFVNKMDISHRTKQDIVNEIKSELNIEPIDMTPGNDWLEDAAALTEDMLETYISTGVVRDCDISHEMLEMKTCPLIFGSARTLLNTDAIIPLLDRFIPGSEQTNVFGARVYKISDEEERLTFLKVTGGSLSVRQEILPGEKVSEIRLYSGKHFETVNVLKQGMSGAVKGLKSTYPGQGLGNEKDREDVYIHPVMSYKAVALPPVSSHTLLEALNEMGEEDPLLMVNYQVKTDDIKISLMGTVQKEVIREKLKSKYNIDAEFLPADILYKETIENRSEGHGHFEPLKHFADVVIEISPGERGSGIEIINEIDNDELERGYQNQIIRALSKKPKGVLTGSDLTDVKFILKSGKAHKKHTSGGDFYKASRIALRRALLINRSLLLEPYYKIYLTIPSSNLGRALIDIDKMNGLIVSRDIKNKDAYIEGKVPVSEFNDYDSKVRSYTGGLGKIQIEPGGYDKCHNSEEIISKFNYDYRTDINEPYESIYVHGGGENDYIPEPDLPVRKSAKKAKGLSLDKELEEIFERTYGPVKRYRDNVIYNARDKKEGDPINVRKHEGKKAEGEYIFIDGYNVINAWDDLRELSRDNLDSSREALEDLLQDYGAFLGSDVIVVYDAYRLKGYRGGNTDKGNIKIVFTKEDEKADQYIEREATILSKKGHKVTVVSSDGWVQKIVLGGGALRMSSREFLLDLIRVREEERNYFKP